MQFLNTIAFVSLAAYVFADQSFTLTAKGGDIDTPVTISGAIIGLENGSPATIDLLEPSGLATIRGQYVAITPGGITTTLDESSASKDFGVDDGKFRSGSSENKSQWWACKAPTGYTLQHFQKDGCTEVALLTTSASKPSKPSPSLSEQSKSTPSPNDESSTKTKTKSSSTLVTITPCGPSVSDCTAAPLTSPIVASETNGAAAVQVGAGMMLAAAAAMLV